MRIHQIKARYVNSYLIEEPGSMMVIDVALRGEQYVLGYIHEVLGREPGEVDLVVCTHSDPDHSGGVFKLAKSCNAEVGTPHAMSSRLGRFKKFSTSMVFRAATSLREGMRPRAWRMYANPARTRKARDLPQYRMQENQMGGPADQAITYRLKHGKRLPGFEAWRIVHTPGHSWDSCCYFHAPTRSLVSGDTLLGSSARERLVKPAIYANPRHLTRSIARLKRIDPRAVYPGHGKVISGSHLLDHL